MPHTAILTFTDPDAYYANIRRLQIEGVVTVRGEYRTELTRIDFDRLWMHRGDENLARVLNVTPSVQRASILFATDQRQATTHFSGLELASDEIIAFGFGAASHFRSSASCRWGSMSLRLEDLAAAGQTIIGCDLTSQSFTRRIRPPPAFHARLFALFWVPFAFMVLGFLCAVGGAFTLM